MKINKYILLLSATMVVVSCDLDKFPEGSTVTQDQKNEVVELLPDRISSELNGLKTGLYSHTNLLTDYNNHMDYGFPAACMIYETAGQDLLTLNDQTGYNKFISSQRLLDRNITSTFNAFLWKLYYKHMKTANDILKAIPADAADASLKKYRGQALASRAFDYLQLIQTYQLTYIGHETANGVPLVLETTSDTELMNNPRASVQQVYGRIMEDLDEAITLLTGASARADKAEISVEVAYGLRARANLLMGKWAAAASDAAKAYGTSAPYSVADVSQPTFYNATDNAWIWGIVVTTEDYLAKTGIVNWPSNLCSLTGMGYTTAASATDVAYRLINKNLWEASHISFLVRNAQFFCPIFGIDICIALYYHHGKESSSGNHREESRQFNMKCRRVIQCITSILTSRPSSLKFWRTRRTRAALRTSISWAAAALWVLCTPQRPLWSVRA